MNKITGLTILLMAWLLGSTPALAKKDVPPEFSIEGLALVEKDRRGEIYANPEVDWSVYSQIQLEPASVAFRKNWKRDQNRYDPFKVNDKDMQNIKNRLAELFQEVFTEELSAQGGYVMAESAGADVLTIRPSIINLDVAAPDTMQPGINKSYTEQAGRMTLVLELYDSQTGDLIAKASDRQESPRRGYLQWTNSVTNTAEARRMLQKWAEALRLRLDEARSLPVTD